MRIIFLGDSLHAISNRIFWKINIFQNVVCCNFYPAFSAFTQQAHNVETTLIQRQAVESTLNRGCFNVVCPQW